MSSSSAILGLEGSGLRVRGRRSPWAAPRGGGRRSGTAAAGGRDAGQRGEARQSSSYISWGVAAHRDAGGAAAGSGAHTTDGRNTTMRSGISDPARDGGAPVRITTGPWQTEPENPNGGREVTRSGGERLSLGPVVSADADVAAVPAHAARRPGRRRGRQPPAARASRLHPPGRGRASTPGCRSASGCCARSSRSCARRWTRPARRRCCCRSRSHSSCGSAAAATSAYGPLMFRLARPQGDAASACRRPPRRSSRRSSRRSTSSYRDLPVNLYQINWKYRDELRPRFGLLRGREFLMKDAYSFDADLDGSASESTNAMYDAYYRIFDALRAHVPRRRGASPARSAATSSREFMAVAAVGEDDFVWCEDVRLRRQRRSGTRARRSTPSPSAPACRATRRRWKRCTRPTCRASPASREFLGRRTDDAVEVHRVRRRRRARARARSRRPRGQRVRARARRSRRAGVRLYGDDDFAAHPELPKGYIGPHYSGRGRRRRRPVGRAPAPRGSPARTTSTTTCATRCSAATSRSTCGPPLVTSCPATRARSCGHAAVGRPRHRGRARVPARHEVQRGARRALHRRERRRSTRC